MKSYFRILIIGLMLAFSYHSVFSQVSINTNGSLPDNSAMLDVKSTAKGLLIPRMTQAQRNAIIDPANSLMIYQTDIIPGYYYNSGNTVSPTWVLAGTLTGVTGTAPIISSGGTAPMISITPATTTVAGSMSAADKTKLNAITGTNTGDQTITLTGDVTGSGTGSFAATISSASVTNTKMANMAANSIKVNNSVSSARPSDLSINANSFPARSSSGNIAAKTVTDFALTVLDDTNAAAVRTTIGAGTGNGTVTGVTGTAPIVSSGGNTPVISISPATTSTAGSMSSADKTKLDRSTHIIGESYGGGIVFYVYDNGQHGLIAATSDQSTGIQWSNGTLRVTGTTGDGLNAGVMNTAIIIATQMADNQSGNFAAKICADYSVTIDGITYGDWYLPSKYELNLLYLQKAVVGGFTDNFYWSSSEYFYIDYPNKFAWAYMFLNGAPGPGGKESLHHVRAIRAF
jgi:hypothetical protein